ncbi:MAG: D-isomer specific 2-hydroxyacid dehydrogenase NAD-binding protein [Clostridia bacterium]|nr:D-isomer specific 2-hydroxyacid dehydrogenase NAD-binding protein [Clostridia bacterium]
MGLIQFFYVSPRNGAYDNMFTIKTVNKISNIGTDLFDKSKFACSDKAENPEGILVRSASLHEYEFNENLLAIARAGAGVNNIPVPKCSDDGIVVFNTPGANANAVKELVIAGLLFSSRKIYDGMAWTQTLKGKGDEVPALVEKGKGAFVGPEIEGKKLGVIGLGAIGFMVANAAVGMGMEVYGYDPFITVDSAWHLSRSVIKANDVKTILENCDYITYHVPLTPETKASINKDTIAMMKDGVRILNFSRGELANENDLAVALESGKVACYATDFPDEKVLSMKNVIVTPHLGASTPESEDNCAVMAVKQIADYLLNGNIQNSVNYPNVSSERSSGTRFGVFHKNMPNMLSKISAMIGDENLNIDKMNSKSKGENSYALLDLTDVIDGAQIAKKIEAIEGVVRVRVIQ